MVRRTSGASMFNIYKFSDVLGMRTKETGISKRDDCVMDALLFKILSHCRDFQTGVMFSILGFQLLHEQGSFTVTVNAIFVLW